MPTRQDGSRPSEAKREDAEKRQRSSRTLRGASLTCIVGEEGLQLSEAALCCHGCCRWLWSVWQESCPWAGGN